MLCEAEMFCIVCMSMFSEPPELQVSWWFVSLRAWVVSELRMWFVGEPTGFLDQHTYVHMCIRI